MKMEGKKKKNMGTSKEEEETNKQKGGPAAGSYRQNQMFHLNQSYRCASKLSSGQ